MSRRLGPFAGDLFHLRMLPQLPVMCDALVCITHARATCGYKIKSREDLCETCMPNHPPPPLVLSRGSGTHDPNVHPCASVPLQSQQREWPLCSPRPPQRPRLSVETWRTPVSQPVALQRAVTVEAQVPTLAKPMPKPAQISCWNSNAACQGRTQSYVQGFYYVNPQAEQLLRLQMLLKLTGPDPLVGDPNQHQQPWKLPDFHQAHLGGHEMIKITDPPGQVNLLWTWNTLWGLYHSYHG